MVLQAIELCVDTLGLHITVIIHIIITIKFTWENSQAKSLSVLSTFHSPNKEPITTFTNYLVNSIAT